MMSSQYYFVQCCRKVVCPQSTDCAHHSYLIHYVHIQTSKHVLILLQTYHFIFSFEVRKLFMKPLKSNQDNENYYAAWIIENVTQSSLACSRHSDVGDCAELNRTCRAQKEHKEKKNRGIFFAHAQLIFCPLPTIWTPGFFPSSIFCPHPTNFPPTPYHLNAWNRLSRLLPQKRKCPRGERKLPTNRLLGMCCCAG